MGSIGSGASGVYVTIRDYSGFSRQALKGFVMMEGVCVRGPVNKATLCSDYEEFQQTFGGLHSTYDFPYLVKRAMSYGARVVVNRIAHYEDPADPTTLTATRGEATLVDRADPAKSTLGITAINEGAWSGKIKWTVTDGTINPSTEFNITFRNDSDAHVTPETYQNASMDPSAANYILKLVNGVSKIVTLAELGDGTDYAERRPATGTGYLSEGDDGLEDLNANDYIGDEAAGLGLYSFDEIDYSMLLSVPECIELDSPGPEAVQAAVTTYCSEHRLKMVYGINAIPLGLTPSEARDYRNGVSPSYTPINDWTQGIFYGDISVLDPRTGTSLTYVNPLGDVCGAIARGHSDRREWFPVAGWRYSLLHDVYGIRYNLAPVGKRGQADILADAQVNMIVSDESGAYIDGMATMQRAASTLSNETTAWLVMVMKKALYKYGRGYLYLPIGPSTWQLMANELDPWLAGLKGDYGFYAYDLQCDQYAPDIYNGKLNKPETIEQGILYAQIAIKPTSWSKWVGFTVSLTKLTAKFEDFETLSLV